MGSWSISICRYLFGRLNWPLIPFPKFCGHVFYCNISIKQWEIGEIGINLRWFRWRYLKSWPSCLSIHPMNGEVVEIPATSCGKPTWCNSDALLWKNGQNLGELSLSWLTEWLQFRFVIDQWLPCGWYVSSPHPAPFLRHHLVAALAFLCALRMQVWGLGPIVYSWCFRLGEGQVEDWSNGIFVSKICVASICVWEWTYCWLHAKLEVCTGLASFGLAGTWMACKRAGQSQW